MNKNIICIYHADCADGFGAAWVVRKALGNIMFHPAKYNEPPPDVTGKSVYIVDFSYKRQVLLDMAEAAESIMIIDHHKTAAADLADLNFLNITTLFDMNRSGAMLAWSYFFPNSPTVPTLLLNIEDRDLWKFNLHGTHEITAALFSYPQAFSVWDELMTKPDVLYTEGVAIMRKQCKDLQEVLKATQRHLIISGHIVPAANVPYMLASDAGHIMAEGAPFAACYYDAPEGRKFSLRSTDDGLDVSEIAAQYGGGGHRNAAGFTLTLAEASAFELK
jgi:oligoribonuclease NrnB/cAMP/cGMP phosphodiesterase (DHH superfamily)